MLVLVQVHTRNETDKECEREAAASTAAAAVDDDGGQCAKVDSKKFACLSGTSFC